MTILSRVRTTRPPTPVDTGIETLPGKTPSTGYIREVYETAQYLRGRGHTVIPWTHCAKQSGSSVHVKYYTDGYAFQRLWFFRVAGTGEFTVTVGSVSQTYDIAPDKTGAFDELFAVLSEYFAPGIGLETSSAAFSGSGNYTVRSVACFEAPRAFLPLGTGSDAVSVEAVQVNMPLTRGPDHWQGVYDIVMGQPGLKGGLWSMQQPAVADSTSWAKIFFYSRPYTFAARRIGNGSGSLYTSYSVRASIPTGDGVYEVRITTPTGVSVIDSISGSTPTWYDETNEDLFMEMDDPSETDGVSANTGEFTIETRRVSGTGAMTIHQICVYERKV